MNTKIIVVIGGENKLRRAENLKRYGKRMGSVQSEL